MTRRTRLHPLQRCTLPGCAVRRQGQLRGLVSAPTRTPRPKPGCVEVSKAGRFAIYCDAISAQATVQSNSYPVSVTARWAGTKKWERRFGLSIADKRAAAKCAEQVNGSVVLGTFQPDSEERRPLPCNGELRRWHRTYAPTLSRSFEISGVRMIEREIIPASEAKI